MSAAPEKKPLFGHPVRIIRPGSRGERTTVAVLGSPRGGTSMLAGLISQLGVFMGERVDPANNEDRDFILHEGDIERLTNRSRAKERRAILAGLRETVARRNAEHAVWGWKDPLAAYYIDDLLRLLDNLHVLVITRDVAAVVEREVLEAPADRLDPLLHLSNTMEHYRAAFAFIGKRKVPVALVSYERTLRRPADTILALADFLGLSRPEPRRLETLVRYVLPDRLTGQTDGLSPGAPILGTAEARLVSRMLAVQARLAATEAAAEPGEAFNAAYAELLRTLTDGRLEAAEDMAFALIKTIARTHPAVALGPEAVILETAIPSGAPLPDVLVALYHALALAKYRAGDRIEAGRYFAAAAHLAEDRLRSGEMPSPHAAALLWSLRLHEALCLIEAGNGWRAIMLARRILAAEEGGPLPVPGAEVARLARALVEPQAAA